MTKSEKEKCEKLCLEAIRNIERASLLYKEVRKIGIDKVSVELREADQKQGYAEGINQVLATLGYKSNSTKKLSKLL